MNERGFFTVVGLCLLLVAAIFIKGVHEFEANYSNGSSIFLLESELQNIADSALIESVNKIPEDYKSGKPFPISVTPIKHSNRIKNLNVTVHGIYYNMNEKKDIRVAERNLPPAYGQKTGLFILSVASCDNDFLDEKSYRHSLAYIEDETDEKIINFINEFNASDETEDRSI